MDTQVAIVGGGVVGCAVAHALARRGVESVLLEAETGLALGASGTNSGILHTGFDSTPGELETRLILRAAVLREQLAAELALEVWRCGARLAPSGAEQLAAVDALEAGAMRNGVAVQREPGGALLVAGESITDPVAFVHALAAAACSGEPPHCRIELGARVTGLRRDGDGVAIELQDGRSLRARGAVNAAGLFADQLAALAGDEIPAVYPRKGEFLVFASPSQAPLREILLPVPSALGKGVLVFPTLDGLLVAGPTAREREDKEDWSVEHDAEQLILDRARAMYPPLEHAEPIGAYAGLRPAGREANYVIEPSRALPGLIHAAAIRSTGLSASLAIGEHIVSLLAETAGVALGPPRALSSAPLPRSPSSAPPRSGSVAPRGTSAPVPAAGPRAVGSRAGGGVRWWERAALHRGLSPSTERRP